jgi:hypothetical protein
VAGGGTNALAPRTIGPDVTRLRLLLAASLAVALVMAAAPAAAAAVASGSTSPACAGKVDVVRFQFFPPSVARGATASARIVARNCLGQTEDTVLTTFGHFTGKKASGCPVIDPLARQADFKPHGGFSSKVGYEVPGECDATHLLVTARFTDSTGALLTTATATLSIT